ncbi:MAG: TIGR04282 family arsenosugar biosynthesis glycosyltransferase [Bacteroidota bacterium]
MANSQNALIIFIKNPEKGKVKTRLADSVGEDKALEIYEILLNKTLEIVTNVNCKKFLYYSDKVVKEDKWNNNLFIKKLQKGNNLGERMLHAFSEVFAEDGIKNVAIIGSDCPSLPSTFIEKAFDELRYNSFVIGPAYDGGYYLLAMRALRYEIFEKIIWSGPYVLSDTLKKINKMVNTYYLLPALPDVDTLEDWELYKKSI